MRPITGWLLAGLVCLAASGCATVGARETAAEAAAIGFEETLASADSGRACASLAPATREELEGEAEVGCGRALAALEVPAAVGGRSPESKPVGSAHSATGVEG
ncbi:hypothetical protein [Streptomyces sp. 147326]|uniref:hypothetical protein n=1 Tax=Streptomyces sp. 147326 TaxID=3074379 RepID=UPI0038579327